MILTCPNCGTQYVVKDGAVPPQGRQVRCAACKHSWHQDPEGDSPAAAAAPAEPEEETIAEATLIEPRSGPEAEERAYEAAMAATDEQPEHEPAVVEPDESPPPPTSKFPVSSEAGETDPVEAEPAATDWRAPPGPEAQDDEFSPFVAREDEMEPRRRRPFVTVLMLALIVAALAAIFWFLAPPEWKARVGLADAGTSPLALVTTHMDRQQLESGNELLTVTGRVINPTGKDQPVPPLEAQLRTRTGQLVYRWTIAPPARTLPPGASASFNSAEVNVPPGGDELTITLGSPKA